MGKKRETCERGGRKVFFSRRVVSLSLSLSLSLSVPLSFPLFSLPTSTEHWEAFCKRLKIGSGQACLQSRKKKLKWVTGHLRRVRGQRVQHTMRKSQASSGLKLPLLKIQTTEFWGKKYSQQQVSERRLAFRIYKKLWELINRKADNSKNGQRHE